MNKDKSWWEKRLNSDNLSDEDRKLQNQSVNFITIDGLQSKLASKWKNEHVCKYSTNSGAIGGQFTYAFTNTSLGQIFKVQCACGEEVDLTDYMGW